MFVYRDMNSSRPVNVYGQLLVEMHASLQLKFEEDLAITKMYSGEGEDVPFCETLYPKGNVEDWLLEVERVMRASLKAIIEEALEDYTQVLTLSICTAINGNRGAI